ncbi:MAG: hypothetical protein D6722_13855 [Bacteroidetes bacterium]|nr:MAG: hypothetical protein D6722_13855 [Bacteroidota bacterium]
MRFPIFCLAVFGFFLACTSPKEALMNDVDQLVTEAQAGQNTYDEKEWADKNDQLQTILKEDYPRCKDDMSPEEKAHLWSQVVSFHVIQYQERAFQALEENQDVYEQMLAENEEFITRLSEEFTQNILPELERSLPEFERLSQDLIQRLEDSGSLDRIKEAAEELTRDMERIQQEGH